MTRWYLLLTMLVFAKITADYNAGDDVGYYDTLVHLAAAGSEVRSGRRERRAAESSKKKKRFSVGKRDQLYYHSIVEEAVEKKWSFPAVLSYSLEYQAFDDCGKKISLSNSLFGSGTTIKDIFLLAKLSDDDKLALHPKNKPPIPVFGDKREEQYLALIAPTKVNIATEQHSFDCNFGALYRLRPIAGTKMFCIVGFNIPVKGQTRSMNAIITDGSLFTFGFAVNKTIREDILTQFFKDFVSVEDFFYRAVLGAKGIAFEPNQQKVGIGDISLVGIVEFGPFFRELNGFCFSLDSAQIGLNVSLPTGSRATGSTLWEIDFGNPGKYQVTVFGSAAFRTESNLFNPIVHGGIEINTTASGGSGGVRIPRIVKHTDLEQRIGDNPDIITPVFNEYFSDLFEEVDSTVAIFADRVFCSDINIGNRIFVGVGNFFYNVFKTDFRLGIFYNYSRKFKDKIVDKDGSSSACPSIFANSISHSISWNLTYQFKKLVEVGFGSQHIVAGRNVPQQHEIFLSLSTAF